MWFTGRSTGDQIPTQHHYFGCLVTGCFSSQTHSFSPCKSRVLESMSCLFPSNLMLFEFYEKLWAISGQENICMLQLPQTYQYIHFASRLCCQSCEKQEGLRALLITEHLASDFLLLDVFLSLILIHCHGGQEIFTPHFMFATHSWSWLTHPSDTSRFS